MSNQNQFYPITFTPSGTPVTITPGILGNPGTFSMPAYDAANLDLLFVSNSGVPVNVVFPGGGILVKPYSTMMLTANAATLANNTNPLAASMTALGSTATTCQAGVQDQYCGTVTIQRGTAVAKPVF